MEPRNRFQVTNSASQCTLANFLRSPGYINVGMGFGLSGHKLAEEIPWNRFVGSICFTSIPFVFFRSYLSFFWNKPSSLRFHLFKFMNKQKSISIDLSFVWNKQSSLRFDNSYIWNKQRSLRFSSLRSFERESDTRFLTSGFFH